MGGNLSGSSAATGGLNALSLINDVFSRQKIDKTKLKQNAFATGANIRKRRNLLEEQLAARRAAVGAQGIASSASADAVESRLATDAARDIAEEYNRYYGDVDEMKQKRDYALRSGLLNLGSSSDKIIK